MPGQQKEAVKVNSAREIKTTRERNRTEEDDNENDKNRKEQDAKKRKKEGEEKKTKQQQRKEQSLWCIPLSLEIGIVFHFVSKHMHMKRYISGDWQLT